MSRYLLASSPGYWPLRVGLMALVLVASLSLAAQPHGFAAPNGTKKVVIPFSFHNGFIVVDVLYQGFFPMKFVFDTGAEYTIITKRDIAESLGVNYTKSYRILGSDMTTELVAYLSRGVELELNGLLATSQDLLVLEDDYFRLDEFTGVPIQGILGANFFRHLIFEINYRRQTITFYFPQYFDPTDLRGFTTLDIDVVRGKPYLKCELEVRTDEAMQAKLLLDTGASLGLLLHTDSSGLLRMPENIIPGAIGSGLGGQLNGYLGRIERIQLDDFFFSGLVVNFQQMEEALDTSFLNNRNGILGNMLLHRFILVFDYFREKVYLRPQRRYNKGFRYDRSGLTLIASGVGLNNFLISNILPHSPAAEAGLEVGDQIIGINGLNRRFYDLNHLNKVLQKRVGKRIRLKVIRNEQKKTFQFQLRDLI
ncbi:MAG: aspartyl protease family protein [Bacteroidota bacterium]